MAKEPMQSGQDPFDVGCVATCSAGIACIAGAIFSTWMVYFTAFITGIIGSGTGLGVIIIWHVLMGCILLGSISFIVKQQALLKARIYRVMAALGFTFGYVAMWVFFAFGNLR